MQLVITNFKIKISQHKYIYKTQFLIRRNQIVIEEIKAGLID